MTDDEVLQQKDIEYYAAMADAWVTTKMEKDRGLLTLSAGGIGLLVSLYSMSGVQDLSVFVIFIFAAISFCIALFLLIAIFDRNAEHLEAVIHGNEKQDSLLAMLDHVASTAFTLGVVLTIIMSIVVGMKKLPNPAELNSKVLSKCIDKTELISSKVINETQGLNIVNSENKYSCANLTARK